MPTSLNSGSMPKVRASSGMIGTIRGPSSGSRIRFRSIRVKTIVVETGVVAAGGELGVDRRLPARAAARPRTVRCGSGPPSARRRSMRYWTSSESGPGW